MARPRNGIASPQYYGNARVTVVVRPDGRFTSVWRQAGGQQRSRGTWNVERELLVLGYDSLQPVPPTLSLRHDGDVVYGTAVVALPAGRSTVVITLTRG